MQENAYDNATQCEKHIGIDHARKCKTKIFCKCCSWKIVSKNQYTTQIYLANEEF